MDYNDDKDDEDFGKMSGILRVYMDSGLDDMAQVSRSIEISCAPASFSLSAGIDINDEVVVSEDLQKKISVNDDKKSLLFFDMANGEL